ncbi:MAG: S-adenosylmethionine:tRNA ribosyltransferase-isomerase [Actinomycetota bacterium]|nr:S-adenosylmethionine:tRNA ribosyltransferase-isomerase [Actinomycetota bacterium]
MSALELAAPVGGRASTAARAPNRRDVAMLVTTRSDGALAHARFDDLPRHLAAGDLLVVNTSATLPAAVAGRLAARPVELHLSTPAPEGTYVVELRTSELRPLRRPPLGAGVELAGGGQAQLLAPFAGSDRLCVARLLLGAPLERYLARHGRPIRYRHSDPALPIDAYQTVFAREPGSAEMPSAARPFTAGLVTELVAGGVLVAPITLHAGVSSLEHGEVPYPERYRVPAATARLVNAVRSWGGRVVAVGTTVVRALETVATPGGVVAPGEGLTGLTLGPERGLRAIDGLLTGWHEFESSHLELLEAAAGPHLLRRSYAAAQAHGYRWHEFGDSHLILP